MFVSCFRTNIPSYSLTEDLLKECELGWSTGVLRGGWLGQPKEFTGFSLGVGEMFVLGSLGIEKSPSVLIHPVIKFGGDAGECGIADAVGRD